jgi:hypothetical protein
MRFVLANRLLDHAGGTEVHLLTLAVHLQGLGHEVVLYSPQLGPFSDHARHRGVAVVGQLRELPDDCHVVLSQDTLVAYDLAKLYPAAFHAFRVCGDVFDFQLPPQLAGIVDLVVVLSDRYARLAHACQASPPVLRLRMPIDADRLVPVAPIRALPRRAALLGNYDERQQLVRGAWGPRGVEVVRIGGPEQRYDLADALADVDIVVAKGRAALDAMACGRAVYVFDVLGGDGWVTPASYAALEADNFAGQATDRVIDSAQLEADLAHYHQQMGAANRDLIAQHHSARQHAIELVNAVAAHKPAERPAAPLLELSRLTALAWAWQQRARDLEQERVTWVERVQGAELREGQALQATQRAQLLAGETHASAERQAAQAQLACEHQRAQIARLEQQLEQAGRLAHSAASAQTQLDAVRATRAWRLATLYWRTRDRLTRRHPPPG